MAWPSLHEAWATGRPSSPYTRAMRVILSVFLVTLLSLVAAAQTAEKGVFVEDIDKSANACTDFFAYANGAWRAANPIPAEMDRWSRRWKAGEQNKEQLRVLLDDVSKRKDWPKGSIDQQISDFYGGCMDQARIDAAGTKPIQPLLEEIRAVEGAAGLQRVIAKLHDLQMNAPFGITSTPDNHNPSNVIAKVYAAGLGLPDRDYYSKPDKRFADAREKYVVHVAKMFELAGWTKAAAKKASDTVFAMELRLAAAHLDNTQLRDPLATDD